MTRSCITNGIVCCEYDTCKRMKIYPVTLILCERKTLPQRCKEQGMSWAEIGLSLLGLVALAIALRTVFPD